MPVTIVPDEVKDPVMRQQAFSEMVRDLLSARYDHPPLAYVRSFGCQQNSSDGETIKGMLAVMGYGFTDTAEDADFVIYNTCAIREHAEDRVYGNVGALKPIKMQKPDMIIALCGCMMQQQSVSEKIRKSYPYVDVLFGTHALHTLPELLYTRLSGGKRQFSNEDSEGKIIEGLPVLRDGGVKAKLPIMYGCNNFCTYCIVPSVRGRERSRDPKLILKEAQALVNAGYKEIMLLGQNVNSYGKGFADKVDFSDLLRQINGIDGEFVLRFMTSHPRDCTPRLLDTIAACDKVSHHIHLPVQSGNNRILKEMNRHYTVEHYQSLVAYARKVIPDVGFSSDIIVGFPGETRAEFEDTLALIREIRYNALYTFIYSPRGGTRAAVMPDPVPAAEKSAWLRELLDVQSGIRDQIQQSYLGKTVRVLVDSEGKTGDGWLSGRTDFSDIVEFRGAPSLIGTFVNIRINQAMNWALFGDLV